jgi:integrase
VRPGELRQAEWAAFDVGERDRTIATGKIRMRRPHCISLPRRALSIIEKIESVSGKHRHLFPCQEKRDRPTCKNTLNLALQRLEMEAAA